MHSLGLLFNRILEFPHPQTSCLLTLAMAFFKKALSDRILLYIQLNYYTLYIYSL